MANGYGNDLNARARQAQGHAGQMPVDPNAQRLPDAAQGGVEGTGGEAGLGPVMGQDARLEKVKKLARENAARYASLGSSESVKDAHDWIDTLIRKSGSSLELPQDFNPGLAGSAFNLGLTNTLQEALDRLTEGLDAGEFGDRGDVSEANRNFNTQNASSVWDDFAKHVLEGRILPSEEGVQELEALKAAALAPELDPEIAKDVRGRLEQEGIVPEAGPRELAQAVSLKIMRQRISTEDALKEGRGVIAAQAAISLVDKGLRVAIRTIKARQGIMRNVGRQSFR